MVVIEEELEKEETPIQNSRKEQPTKNNITISTSIILDPVSKLQQKKKNNT